MRGSGSISGTIKQGGIEKSGMVLYLVQNNRVIRETVSNSLGQYQFTNLRTTVKYDVYAIDPSGNWETLVSSKRSPG